VFQVKFNLENRTCWDGEFLFDISISGGVIKTFAKFWGIFRIHGDSISGSGRLNDLYLADRKRISKRYSLLAEFEFHRYLDWVFKLSMALKRRLKKFKFKYVKRISV
jgi:hypothetical protein